MSSNMSAAGGSRVYLRMKRRRHNWAEDACPPLIKVKWDGMMGPPSLAGLSYLDGTSNAALLFRRLPAKDHICGPELEDSRAYPTTLDSDEATVLDLDSVRRGRGCILLDCAGPTSSTAATCGTSVEVFVLSDSAHWPRASINGGDEFDFDALTVDDAAPRAASTTRRRGREDNIPEYSIRPPRPRTEEHSGTLREAVDATLVDFLMGYDDALQGFISQESAAEAQADLYCYPDHRKDDEYDSNAEDFSGNEYPDADYEDGGGGEAGGDYCCSTDGCCSLDGRCGGGPDAYGMYCEEEYSERPLSDGWMSDC